MQADNKSYDDINVTPMVDLYLVPHAHLHLVPINEADDLNFTRPKLKLSADELKEVQSLILSNL